MKKVDCEKCKKLRIFYRFLDKELSKEKGRELREYLAKYETCAKHFNAEKELRSMIRKKAGEFKIRRDLREKIVKRIFKKSGKY